MQLPAMLSPEAASSASSVLNAPNGASLPAEILRSLQMPQFAHTNGVSSSVHPSPSVNGSAHEIAATRHLSAQGDPSLPSVRASLHAQERITKGEVADSSQSPRSEGVSDGSTSKNEALGGRSEQQPEIIFYMKSPGEQAFTVLFLQTSTIAALQRAVNSIAPLEKGFKEAKFQSFSHFLTIFTCTFLLSLMAFRSRRSLGLHGVQYTRSIENQRMGIF